jgi:hypothetical protein
VQTICSTVKRENQHLKEALRMQTAAYRELESKAAALQWRLMKREIGANEPCGHEVPVQKQIDEAIEDLMRAKTTFVGVESKAKAASKLAVVEVALKDLRSRAGEEGHPQVFQAKDLLEKSVLEFNRKNYGGSLRLTLQAESLIQAGEERWKRQKEDPVSLLLALPLRVLKKSNLRKGPGLDFEVLLTLDEESHVTGHAYKGHWVRVETGDGQTGWIFHSLVDIP